MAKKIWKARNPLSFERPKSKVAEVDVDRGDPNSVCRLLKTTREALGLELQDIAKILRIRYPYLKAIEDNRINELPGYAYAVGFVRAYSEHLGLDSSEIVLKFRREVEILNSKPELVFPVPVVEAKVPGGAVLLVAIFLAVLIYGSWIYLDERTIGDSISDLQDRILMLTGEKIRDLPSESKVVSNELGSLVVKDLKSVSPKGQGVALSLPTGHTVAESKLGVETYSDPAPANLSKRVTDTPAPQTIISRANIKGEKMSITGADRAQIPANGSQDYQALEPIVYGEENKNARVRIYASGDSWVEIRDSNDKLLLTRVLRIGDLYLVPDRSGITMITGNAGALNVMVDGITVGKLGPLGSVRRNVRLEPELLISNSAHKP